MAKRIECTGYILGVKDFSPGSVQVLVRLDRELAVGLKLGDPVHFAHFIGDSAQASLTLPPHVTNSVASPAGGNQSREARDPVIR